MADSAVLGLLCKVLCAQGGRLELPRLQLHVALPEQQLRALLEEAGPGRFLLLRRGGSTSVLAVSGARVCVRRQCPGCPRLHLCKSFLLGRCRVRACKYNHDIFSEENQKVLKNHELSGLNEDELRVLLLQNDPFFLPDVCKAYNKGDGNCPLQENCPKLHVCSFFLRGECRFPRCKRIHNLMSPAALRLLLAEGVDDNVASNIQRICEHKTLALFNEIHVRKDFRPIVNIPRVNRREHRHEQTSDNSTLMDSSKLSRPSLVDLELGTKGFVFENSGYFSTSGGSDKPVTGDQEEYKSEDAGCASMQKPEQGPVKTPLGNLSPVPTPMNLSFAQAPVKTPLVNPSPVHAPVKALLDLDTHPKQAPVKALLDLDTHPKQAPVKALLDLDTHPKQAPVMTFLDLDTHPEQAPVKFPALDVHKQASVKTSLLDSGLSSGIKVSNISKPESAEKKKSDEICLFYVWRFCKNKNDCSMVHYHLPYRWQIQSGVEWKDCANVEEIEKAYCDPSNISFPALNINFKTMLSYINPIRRLSTPSSVMLPAKFVMTTKWLWYWKNDLGQWIEYGKPDGQRPGSNLSSDDLENVFLADPNGSIQFQAGSQHYEINFKEMTQKNLHFLTQRELRRRPKFVSAEDVKKKKGNSYADHATGSASTSEANYPEEWDNSALPEIGYKAIEVSKTSPEFAQLEKLFRNTMDTYVIHKIRRIQNPSLWQVFQWQKDQMKKKRGGQNVEERLLFHGTSSPSVLEAICNENFDWRICGTNGTVYGKGSYFARDAQYSHNYCQRDAKMKTMFVAKVLVGDFAPGHATYNRPPAKSAGTINCYDSCVNNLVDPSVFVIFEKHQIYPAYMIDYTEEEKKCIIA